MLSHSRVNRIMDRYMTRASEDDSDQSWTEYDSCTGEPGMFGGDNLCGRLSLL